MAADMHGEPIYNQPNQLEPFCGVKAAQIKISVNTQTLYELPLRFAMVRINHQSTGAVSNAIDLPTPAAAYDSQSQVTFVWWDIDAAHDGVAVSLTWLYPRVSTSPAYPYSAVPINGALSDFVFTRGTTDTRRNIFFIVVATPHQGYYIRAVQDGSLMTSITSANAKLTVTQVGQAFTLTDNVSVAAGTGTSVSGSPTFTVSAFAGVPAQVSAKIVAATATQYFGVNSGIASATETDVCAFMVSQPGTITNLYVEESSVVATSTSHTFTLRSGATYAALADSTLTCAIATGALSAEDTTHSLVVAAGDVLTVKLVQAGGNDAAKGLAIGFLFKPSIEVSGTPTFTVALEDNIVTPGTYGSSTLIPSITVDTYGRTTAISTNSIPVLDSGYYLPVFTWLTNGGTSPVSNTAYYLRVGNTVIVQGRIASVSTTANTATASLSLPILPSINFTSVNNVMGFGEMQVTNATTYMQIAAQSGANYATLSFNTSLATYTGTFRFQFIYNCNPT